MIQRAIYVTFNENMGKGNRYVAPWRSLNSPRAIMIMWVGIREIRTFNDASTLFQHIVAH